MTASVYGLIRSILPFFGLILQLDYILGVHYLFDEADLLASSLGPRRFHVHSPVLKLRRSSQILFTYTTYYYEILHECLLFLHQMGSSYPASLQTSVCSAII